MNSTTTFLLIAFGSIALALLLFFLTGFSYVKKNQICFLKKHGHYVKTLKPGWHYAMPLFFQVSKRYTIHKEKLYSVVQNDHKTLQWTAYISDPKLFEFSKITYKQIAKRLYEDSQGRPYEEGLKSALATIGMVASQFQVR